MGISGLVEGKDTVGEITQWLIATDKASETNKKAIANQGWYDYDYSIYSNYQIRKFATKLKQIASLLTGIPVEKFEDQEFKKSFMPKEWSTHFAGALKEYKGTCILDRYEKGKGFQITVREFLQKLGKAYRDHVHEDIWVNALFADYSNDYYDWSRGGKQDTYPNWIITDCRYPNEAQAIKDRGGIIIRVNRSLEDCYLRADGMWIKFDDHDSEISLDEWEFDYRIDNNDTLKTLENKVKELLIHYSIIS